jgi:hypothetical protein
MPHLLIKLLLLLQFAAVVAAAQPVISCTDQEQGQVTTLPTKNHFYRIKELLEKDFLKKSLRMPHLLLKLLLLLMFAAVRANTQPVLCCIDQVQGQVTTSQTKKHWTKNS